MPGLLTVARGTFADAEKQFADPAEEDGLVLMVATGHTNQEIADRYRYTVDTIKKLIGILAKRWDATDRTNLVYRYCVAGRLVVGHHRIELGHVTVEEYERRRDQLAGDLIPLQAALLAPVAEGLTNRAIGHRLKLTQYTVQHHLKAARQLWGARTRTHWVYIACCHELLAVGDTPLSEMELHAVRLVDEGLSTDNIARRMSLPADTVRTHLVRASRKFRVHSRSQLATIARLRGLIGGDTDA